MGSKARGQLKTLPGLQDVASDLEHTSPQLMISINRDLASRLGVNPNVIESTLYDALGQRHVTQIYAPLNTYRVVMEVAPAYQKDVSALTLFTIPVTYVYMERLSEWFSGFATPRHRPAVIPSDHALVRASNHPSPAAVYHEAAE